MPRLRQGQRGRGGPRGRTPKKKVSSTTVVAYKPSRTPEQLGGGSDTATKPTWDCTACGTTNAIDTSTCGNCHNHKGIGVPTELPDHRPVHLNKGKTKKKLRDYTVTGQPLNPITGNAEGPTPAGHKAQRPVFASLPNVREDDDDKKNDDDEDDFEDDVEFKQLRKSTKEAQLSYSTAPASGDGVQRLMGLLRKHDNRKRSFDNLFGGPEHDYNGRS